MNNLKVRSNVITVDYGKDSNDVICCLLIYMQTTKKNGWCPPTDERGRIFVNVRALSKEPQDIAPSYNETEHLLRFIDKYVSRAIGNYQIAKWTRANKDKTFMDKVTASDIAYSVIVYENTKEVWEE